MTATVYGNEPMEDLMALADSTLANISNNERTLPDLINPEVVSFDSTNLVSRFSLLSGPQHSLQASC